MSSYVTADSAGTLSLHPEQNILITGGTGSLGHALIGRWYDQGCQLTVISRDEGKQAALKAQYPAVVCVLGDVRDEDWLQLVMRGQDLVIHAAAYKRIPSAQANAGETIKTNVVGSLNVARAAVYAGVKRVVGISTDKAAEPVNVYGASKYIMEGLFQQANGWGDTEFTLTRYGNVIGSNGSVIPFFLRQAGAGGPITVTHRAMTRFWISISEAAALVELALKTKPGVVAVPKAPALAVWDLAELIAREFGGGCEVTEIGIRAGEKIHETMVTPAESFHTLYIGQENHFEIYPPSYRIFTETPWSYTSDDAPRMDDDTMLFWINEWRARENVR